MLSTISGLLYVAGFVPYIAAMLRGQARPNKTTWLIWSLLDIISLIGMLSEGVVSGTMIAGTLGTLLVAGLSFIAGEQKWSKTDAACLIGAVFSITLWGFTRNADVAIVITMTAMLIGTIPTLKSAWTDPKAENKLAWAVYVAGCVAGVLAISEWSITGALQPCTFMLIDGSVALVVFFRKK